MQPREGVVQVSELSGICAESRSRGPVVSVLDRQSEGTEFEASRGSLNFQFSFPVRAGRPAVLWQFQIDFFKLERDRKTLTFSHRGVGGELVGGLSDRNFAWPDRPTTYIIYMKLSPRTQMPDMCCIGQIASTV